LAGLSLATSPTNFTAAGLSGQAMRLCLSALLPEPELLARHLVAVQCDRLAAAVGLDRRVVIVGGSRCGFGVRGAPLSLLMLPRQRQCRGGSGGGGRSKEPAAVDAAAFNTREPRYSTQAEQLFDLLRSSPAPTPSTLARLLLLADPSCSVESGTMENAASLVLRHSLLDCRIRIDSIHGEAERSRAMLDQQLGIELAKHCPPLRPILVAMQCLLMPELEPGLTDWHLLLLLCWSMHRRGRLPPLPDIRAALTPAGLPAEFGARLRCGAAAGGAASLGQQLLDALEDAVELGFDGGGLSQAEASLLSAAIDSCRPRLAEARRRLLLGDRLAEVVADVGGGVDSAGLSAAEDADVKSLRLTLETIDREDSIRCAS
ncbi:hypothetical protein BOX15_Mlig031408g2, partial [Macrostomum lignano]